MLLICQALPGTTIKEANWHIDLATLHSLIHAHGVYRGNDYVWPEELAAQGEAMRARARQVLGMSGALSLP